MSYSYARKRVTVMFEAVNDFDQLVVPTCKEIRVERSEATGRFTVHGVEKAKSRSPVVMIPEIVVAKIHWSLISHTNAP